MTSPDTENLSTPSRASARQFRVIRVARDGKILRRLVISRLGRTRLLEPEHVLWLRAEGNYITVQCSEGPMTVRGPLSSLLATLGPEFVRISRNTVVNVGEIALIARSDRARRLRVVLADGTTFESGRQYTPLVRRHVLASGAPTESLHG